MAEEKKLTTYEEFLAEHERRQRTAIVKTAGGQTFEIKLLSPGDFVMVMNTLLVQKLMPELAAAPDEMSEADQEKAMDLMTNEELLDSIKNVVCQAVVSVNLVNKAQEQCDRAKKEVSIELIDLVTLLELNMAIRKLSVPETESDQVASFRSESGGDEAGDDQGASDSESIQPAPGESAVPGSDES